MPCRRQCDVISLHSAPGLHPTPSRAAALAAINNNTQWSQHSPGSKCILGAPAAGKCSHQFDHSFGVWRKKGWKRKCTTTCRLKNLHGFVPSPLTHPSPALEKQPRVKSGEKGERRWGQELLSSPKDEGKLTAQERAGGKAWSQALYEMGVLKGNGYESRRVCVLKNGEIHCFCSCGLWVPLLCIMLCKEWGAPLLCFTLAIERYSRLPSPSVKLF